MADRTNYQAEAQTLLAEYSDLGYGSLEDPRTTMFQWLLHTPDGAAIYRILGRNKQFTAPGQYTKGPWFTLVDEAGVTGYASVAIPVLADEVKLELKEDDAGTVHVSGRCVILTLDDPGSTYLYTGSFPA